MTVRQQKVIYDLMVDDFNSCFLFFLILTFACLHHFISEHC